MEFMQHNGTNVQYGASPSWTSPTMSTSSPGGRLKAKELTIAIQCHMTTTNFTTTNNAGEYMINYTATMAKVIHYFRGYT